MKLKIAVLPGDGIGPEIMKQGVAVMDAIVEKFGHEVEYKEAICGADAIDKVGDPFPEETFETCKWADAVLFAAVGDPRFDNNPTAQFSEIMNRTLWQDCPYARPVTGTEEEILNLTPDDVKTFYDKHYSPDNAVLVLSGDIDASTAKQLAEKHFGGIEKSGTKTSRNPVCSSIKNNKNVYHIKMSHPEIKTPRVVRRYIAPSLKENPEQAYALMVFSKYFGEGDNSFLNQELVLKNKVAATGSSYDALSRGDGVFSLSAVPSPGKTAAETEDLLQTALNEALKSLNKDKLEKEKHKMTSGLVYIRDNPEDAAMLVGQMAALGFNLNEINDYEKNIKNVTLGDIKEAVSDMLSSSTSITGYLLPAAKEDK